MCTQQTINNILQTIIIIREQQHVISRYISQGRTKLVVYYTSDEVYPAFHQMHLVINKKIFTVKFDQRDQDLSCPASERITLNIITKRHILRV